MWSDDLLLFWCFCVTSAYVALPYVNIALGRPVNSSERTTSLTSVVDGNLDSDWTHGGCVSIATDTSYLYAWLSVDLGVPTYIYGVSIVTPSNTSGQFFISLYIFLLSLLITFSNSMNRAALLWADQHMDGKMAGFNHRQNGYLSIVQPKFGAPDSVCIRPIIMVSLVQFLQLSPLSQIRLTHLQEQKAHAQWRDCLIEAFAVNAFWQIHDRIQ